MILTNVYLIMTGQISAKEPNFAVGVRSTRAKQRSFVEAMKGDFGFLNFEVSFHVHCNSRLVLKLQVCIFNARLSVI